MRNVTKGMKVEPVAMNSKYYEISDHWKAQMTN